MNSQGQAEFLIIDPKQSTWLGLENLELSLGIPCVTRLDKTKPEDILKVFPLINYVLKKQNVRGEQRNKCRADGIEYNPKPFFFIFDEWLVLLKMARMHDIEEKRIARQESASTGEKFIPPESVAAKLINLVEMLLFTSQEDGIIIWVVGQSHLVKDAGFTTGVRSQMAVFAQGRGNDLDSVENCLSDNYLVPKSQRKRLERELQTLRSQVKNNPGSPIAYCSLNGHKVTRMPDLGSIKSKKIFTTQEVEDELESDEVTDNMTDEIF